MDKQSVMSPPARDSRPGLRAPLPLRQFKPTNEAIAKRAYELYQESGYQNGREVEFWLMAERELITER